jgi:surface protein
MFRNATSFNQPIGNWDTSKIETIDDMFWSARAFNQDLSNWCMINITTKPNYFDYNTPKWNKTNRQPVWGTCPGQ